MIRRRKTQGHTPHPPRSEPILSVKDLSVRFNTVDGVVHAVNSISFDLYRGETLGVVGESGSGKSVSMLSLLRLIPEPPGEITSGSAILRSGDESVDLISLSWKQMNKVRGRRVGFVFQDPLSSLNPLISVGKQIREIIERHNIARGSAAKRRSVDLLKQVGISDADNRYHSYPHEFSGGMRQRVMIAIAIACNPELVIADEPTTALDVTIQAQIIDLLMKLKREMGISVIWISHDLGVVAGIADRVMVMYGGTAVETGTAETVYRHPRHPYTVGLLGAIPKLHQDNKRLVNIKGTPPSVYSALRQCPFAPRCPWSFDLCTKQRPPLFALDGNAVSDSRHTSACWYDLEHNTRRTEGAV